MTVTVYTQPGCVQCGATIRKLTELHVPFDVADMNDDIAQYAKDHGAMTAPVVVTDTDLWGGFQPGKLLALVPEVGDRRG